MSQRRSHPHWPNLYKSIAIVITLYLLANCAGQADSHSEVQSLSPPDLSDSLIAAEQLFSERADIDKLRQAVLRLAGARNPDSRNYEVEWKFAKYSYFLGKAEKIEKEAIAAFEKGKEAASIASRLEPDKPDGHFWHGANLGELARISPLTIGLTDVDEIRSSMYSVLSTDPGYQAGSVYDALGQLEMATRTLKGGTTEKAIEYFELGIKLSPEDANLRVNLAEAYLAVRDNEAAKKQLNALFTIKPDPKYAAEHGTAVEKGKTLMSKSF